jgi:hypothetical protein
MIHKYYKTIESIKAAKFSRPDLARMRTKAVAGIERGDQNAQAVLDALDSAIPPDEQYVFMGFCPDANFDNRLDIEWKAKGICTFIFWESAQQSDRFQAISPGDLIILKKRQKIGETMQLFGFGRVKRLRTGEVGRRHLEMDWSTQDRVIEVPLMACNATIDVRTAEKVLDAMPREFFEWMAAPGDAVRPVLS